MREVVITPSTRKGKKWCAKMNGCPAVHFGARQSSDYTIHGDPSRAQRYIERHTSGTKTGEKLTHEQMDAMNESTKEGWDNPCTPGFWSRWLLWSRPRLKSAVQFIKKRFKLKVRIVPPDPVVSSTPIAWNETLVKNSYFSKMGDGKDGAMDRAKRALQRAKASTPLNWRVRASLVGMGKLPTSKGEYVIKDPGFLQLIR